MGAKGTCKLPGCSGDVVGKGYCKMHYRKWRRGELPKARYKTCHHPGCRKRQERAGRCAEHQKRKEVRASEKEAKAG